MAYPKYLVVGTLPALEDEDPACVAMTHRLFDTYEDAVVYVAQCHPEYKAVVVELERPLEERA